jgi:hypothetical protein
MAEGDVSLFSFSPGQHGSLSASGNSTFIYFSDPGQQGKLSVSGKPTKPYLDAGLREISNQGWELVNAVVYVSPTGTMYIAVFKRPRT